MFEIRKNLNLRKNFVTPKIFLKSRFHCTPSGLSKISLGASRLWIYCKTPLEYIIQYTHATPIILSQYIIFRLTCIFVPMKTITYRVSGTVLVTQLTQKSDTYALQSRIGPVRGQNRDFPVFPNRETPFFITGSSFSHYRDFPVRKTSQGKTLFSLKGRVCSEAKNSTKTTHMQFKGLQVTS